MMVTGKGINTVDMEMSSISLILMSIHYVISDQSANEN